MKPTYEELEQERNELAAQVERLRGLLKPKVIDLIRCGIGSNYSGSLFDNAMKEYHEPLVLALSETPPAALAALKAQWQAEALEEVAKDIKEMQHPDDHHWDTVFVLDRAKIIRERAGQTND